MALTIHQKPLFSLLHSGEKIIFTMKDLYSATNYYKVKYIARVYMNRNTANIDDFCCAQNATNYFRVVFNMEFATALQNPLQETSSYKTTEDYMIFNSFLDNEEILMETSGNYGYNLAWNDYIMNDDQAKFLTNAPDEKQYIRDDDFATLAFFTNMSHTSAPDSFQLGSGTAMNYSVEFVEIKYYNSAGGLMNTHVHNLNGNGGIHGAHPLEWAELKYQYFGVGPANVRGGGILNVPTQWNSFTVQAFDDDNEEISRPYYYYRQEDDCKGYETIRLTWLNKFGSWDYYNFTQKNIRTFKKEAVSFQSQDGTWNQEKFKITGYDGGRTVFKNKATELITLNTNFLTDEEAIWLEELFVSNNVFILNKKTTDASNQGLIRKFLEPVMVTTAELKRQTTANDGKKQYTLTISKSKNRRTQRQ